MQQRAELVWLPGAVVQMVLQGHIELTRSPDSDDDCGMVTLSPRVLAAGFVFLEGPRWHDGRLWASDMHDDRVVTVDMDGRVETVATLTQPSGLGWLPDGRLLIVSMIDRTLRCLDRSGLSNYADVSALAAFHLNDMVVDGAGRAYVGNFGYDYEAGAAPVPAMLAMVGADGVVAPAATDLSFPNGMVITPDGRTLIVAETFAHRLTAFDRAADGTLSRRREWAALGDLFPDGICLDAAQGVWVASPISNEVIRVLEGGEITARVPVAQHAIACALGGPERRVLFICTAPAIARHAARARRGGRLEVVNVPVAGAGWP